MFKFLKKFFPGANRPQCVYGPPPEIEEEMKRKKAMNSKDLDSIANRAAGIYGPPSMRRNQGGIFMPDENHPAVVYGPPRSFKGEPVAFDPKNNVPIDVYGPPEMFEDSNTRNV